MNTDNFIHSLHQDAMPKLFIECASALNQFAQICVDTAKEWCPVEFGFLRDNGKILKLATPGNLRVTIGFTAEYAVYVHENLTANHPRGGGAKFLENSMRAHASEFDSFVLEHLQSAFNGGTP